MRSSELAALFLIGCGAATPRPTAPHPLHVTELASGTHESLRGLSLPTPDVIWASGAHGTVLRSIDGGAHVDVIAIPSAEALDFRNLWAFDAERAVVLSAGSPARAFVTRDGGASWNETYTREDEAIFFDSIAFDGDEGIAMGDPLPSEDGARFAVIVSHDGGASWQEREGPIAEEGEAAFAASNGCIALLPEPIFATSHSRLVALDGTSHAIPIAFTASAGVFAIAFVDRSRGYAIGGDYAAPALPGSFARTHDGGETWELGAAPRGYRSSIARLDDALVAVGTSGSDVSRDDGAHWDALDDVPANTIRVREDVAIVVGPDGRVARITR